MFNIEKFYSNRSKSRFLKKHLDFKSFKKVMPFETLKKRYYKDYYTIDEEKELRQLLNIGQGLLDYALRKRRILMKFLKIKYYAMISSFRQLPNRFFKKRKRHFRKKKRKKNLNLRFFIFFKTNYERFLFYLVISNNQYLIKPFNFLTSLFFYKTKTFKRLYIFRKRKRRFRFFYRKLKRKKRKFFARKRKRRLPYRLKKKFILKRYKDFKIKKINNFLRFIAFFYVCKKIIITKVDNFKMRSIFYLPHKLIKLNFNKIDNSYKFFINLKKRRSKIKTITLKDKNNFIKEINKTKLKLHNLIKLKLYNKIKFKILKINNNNLNNFIIQNTINYYYYIIYFFMQIVLFNNTEKLTFKLINTNLIFKQLPNYFINDNKFNILKVSSNNIIINNKLKFLTNHIMKIVYKLKFLKKKIFKLNLKKNKKLSFLFLKFIKKKKKTKKKLLNKYKFKYKDSINTIFLIINKLKEKLEKLLLNFYILYLTFYKKKLNLKKTKFLRKIKYFFKMKKKNKKNLIYSFIFFKKNILALRSDKFTFTYNNKLNNFRSVFIKKFWKKKRFFKRKKRKIKNKLSKTVNKLFPVEEFSLYKNYFIEKTQKLSKFNCFCDKKLKYIFLNYLKKINISNSKLNQKKKNINFLNVN